MSEELVVVHLVIEREDGSIGIGNSHECSLSEAIAMIEQQEAKAEGYPIGVVPDQWIHQA